LHFARRGDLLVYTASALPRINNGRRLLSGQRKDPMHVTSRGDRFTNGAIHCMKTTIWPYPHLIARRSCGNQCTDLRPAARRQLAIEPLFDSPTSDWAIHTGNQLAMRIDHSAHNH
jgi:hypothetical protein